MTPIDSLPYQQKSLQAKKDVSKAARLAALQAISGQGMSINVAARRFGVSRTTLQRLVATDADEDTALPSRGAPTFLPFEVEKMLAEHLKRAVENRVGVAPSRLAHYARVMANYLKIPIGKWTGGSDWRRQFMRRWGLSTLKTGQTTGARYRNFNHLTVAGWFASMGFQKGRNCPLLPGDLHGRGSVLTTGLTRYHAAVKQAKQAAKVWGRFSAGELDKALNLADPEMSAAYRKGAEMTKNRHAELEAQGAVIDPDNG
jgi:transposase